MANKVPVKAIFSGSDVSSLGEFATSDTIAASYINGVPTGAMPLAGGTMTGNIVMADDTSIGISDSAERIEFDGAGDINVLGANLGIGTTSPAAAYGSDTVLEVSGGTSPGLVINDTGQGSKYGIHADSTKFKILYGSTALFDVVGSTGAATFTNSVATGTDTDASNTGSVTLDFAAKQNFVLTLTGNVTLANPTTEQIGQSGFIAFIQDGTGGRTVALGTDYETPAAAGLTLTATASATDLVPYLVVASNRILLGTPQLAFA